VSAQLEASKPAPQVVNNNRGANSNARDRVTNGRYGR
jgi:hypothetical protein